VSWAVWTAEARHLLEVDRAHRAARQSGIVGRQLVPVGRIARFLTVCFAIAIGTLMLLPVDSDVPVNVVVITGVMLASYAPFSGCWLKLSEFERLHAPPAGLLLLRLTRLSPYLALIGLIWAGMLATANDNVWAIVAIGAMPFVISLANVLRAEFWAYGMRVAIVTTFLLGWMQVVGWMPIVTLALDAVVVLWFVRDLGVYDRRGFAVEAETNELRDKALEQALASRKLPDLRTTRRRGLLANATFYKRATQWGWVAYTMRAPLTSIAALSFAVAVWSLPSWAAYLAVWQSQEGVAAVYCVLATVLSASMIGIEPSEHLYLWGVDMRQVERHNLLARVLTVVLPSVGAALVAVLIHGESDARWIAVSLLLGMHLARIGIVAFNALTRVLLFVGFGVGMAVGGAGAATDHGLAFYFAAAFALFGLIGISIRMFRSENALRVHAFA